MGPTSSIIHHLGRRIRRRLSRRVNEAFTFLVATAWSVFFDDVFYSMTGEEPSLGTRALHALAFTLFAVIVSLLFDDDDD